MTTMQEVLKGLLPRRVDQRAPTRLDAKDKGVAVWLLRRKLRLPYPTELSNHMRRDIGLLPLPGSRSRP